MRDFYRGLAKFVFGLAVILAVAAGVLYAFFVKIVEVGHNAMAPTVMVGDTIVVWETNSFELGNAVLCRHPHEAGRYVLGRIVGRSGQTVEITNGHVQINGQSPDRDLHGEITWDDTETGRREQVNWADESILDHDYRYFWRDGRARGGHRSQRVSGGYFLLGDNRLYVGEDSRSFGPVASTDCIGTIVLRLVAGPSPDEFDNGPLDLIE